MSQNEDLIKELEILKKEKEDKRLKHLISAKKYSQKSTTKANQCIFQKKYMDNLKIQNIEKFIIIQQKKKEYNKKLYQKIKEKKLEEKLLKQISI